MRMVSAVWDRLLLRSWGTRSNWAKRNQACSDDRNVLVLHLLLAMACEPERETGELVPRLEERREQPFQRSQLSEQRSAVWVFGQHTVG